MLPTAAENFDQAEISFNLSANNYGSKVVLILETFDQIRYATTDLSIDGGKSITTADKDITASKTLSYADTCSVMLSRGSVLTSPNSIFLNTSLARGGVHTISPVHST